MVPSDSPHDAAIAVMTELYENEIERIIAEYVIVEFADFLSKVELRKLAVLMVDDFVANAGKIMFWRNGNGSKLEGVK